MSELCGGRWGCVLPAGHNMGKADVPSKHMAAYKGAVFPVNGDGPITFQSREALREYLAEHQASALYEAAREAMGKCDCLVGDGHGPPCWCDFAGWLERRAGK